MKLVLNVLNIRFASFNLYYCLNTEWNSLNMGYDFNWYILKAFRNNTIQNILNKHSTNLTDENKGITMEILKKLQYNI